MMLKIRKVNAFSLAKILVFLFFVFSFIEGIIRTVLLLANPAFVGINKGELILSFLVVGPVVFAAIGFIVGLLGGVLYNILAMWLGGVGLYVEEHKTEHVTKETKQLKKEHKK